MIRKSGISFITLFLLLLVVTGCSNPGNKSSQGGNRKTQKVFVLKNASERGDVINAQIKSGIERAANEIGYLEIEFSKVMTKPEEPKNFIKLAVSKEANVIISSDPSYDTYIEDSAAENPNIKYALIESYSKNKYPNVTYYNFDDAELGFFMGYIAAKLSQSKKVAFIGAMDDEQTALHYKGFEFGVGSSKSNVQWKVEYLGNSEGAYENVDYAYSLGNRYFLQGFDVIGQSLGIASKGVFDAAVQNQKNVIGFGLDQSNEVGEYAKKIFLTSVIKRYDVVGYKALQNLLSDKYKAGRILLGTKDDAIDFTRNNIDNRILSLEKGILGLMDSIKKKTLQVPK